MAYIGKKPEDKFRGLASYNSFTGDGSTTAFDVTNILPDGGTYDVEVFVDNVRQEGGSGKSYTIGNDGNGDLKRITFAVAPDNGAEIYVINPGRNTAVVTVTDNSLTAAKLQTDAVTTAKIQDDAVTSAKIADGTIVSSNIAPGTIANDRLANSSITINGNAVSLGGSITAGTDWQAVTVADGSTQLNAVAGKGYFLDTNAGTIDVNLPTSPTRGDTVVIADYGNNFATNRVIINTGGKLIDSVVGGDPGSDGFTIETNGAVVELVFADDTAGWIIKQNNAPADLGVENYNKYITATGGTITTSGDYKIHTFTGDGCFVVSCVGGVGNGPSEVDYLVVAGGGGGGGTNGGDAAGGGGAGGYRESCGGVSGCYTASPLAAPCSAITLSATTYPVTVGAGGTGGPDENIRGTNGSNSVFSTITSTGGGSGGPKGTPRTGPTGVGNPGGSGGGGGGGSPVAVSDGSGNTPPVSPPQGNNGGSGGGAAPDNSGGGGGGAGGTGQPNNTRTSSNPTNVAYGGVGVTTSISGSPTGYAGGGGGGSFPPVASSNTNPGSPFGGGLGGYSNNQTAGSANTGGGGGAGGANPPAPGTTGGAGGKGIVIIRYKFQN